MILNTLRYRRFLRYFEQSSLTSQFPLWLSLATSVLHMYKMSQNCGPHYVHYVTSQKNCDKSDKCVVFAKKYVCPIQNNLPQ